MGEVPLLPIEQLTIRHQFGQVEFATDQWFRLAATTLASVTRSAGIATPAKPRAARIRRFELVPIGDRMASLIIVLNEGTLKQTRSRSTRARPSGTWTRRSGASTSPAPDGARRTWPSTCDGSTRRRPTTRSSPCSAGRRPRLAPPARVRRGERGAAVQRRAAQRHGGARVRRSEKLRRVFEALENRAYFADLFDSVTIDGGLRVFIGRENRRTRWPTSALSSGRTDRRVRPSASSVSRTHATSIPTGHRDRALRRQPDERPRRPPLLLKPGDAVCRST